MNTHPTIVALSSAPNGAIAIIRLSGENAIGIGDKLFKGKKRLVESASHTIHFGKIISPDGEIIDEVLISIFKDPHSYTGENSIEISCHGSSYIIQKIIDLAVAEGALLANAGEFTQRAFLNGKMDLAQAEAVADLIASENKISHQIAMSQMRGGISSELEKLREELIHFTSLIELELDFGEEDVEFANREELQRLTDNLILTIKGLIESFRYGNAIKQGVPVAIIGAPNVGKSTLLNALLKEERAIVSDIAGTTRDTIEETLTIDGIKFRFIDTAGIRQTEDKIESIGIERSMQAIRQAEVVLFLLDSISNIPDSKIELLPIDSDKLIYIANKEDLLTDTAKQKLKERFKPIFISAKNKTGIDQLKQLLIESIKGNITPQQLIISNARHHEELTLALAALDRVKDGMTQQLSGDLLAFHLRDALRHIGEITGHIDIDKDILGTIFSRFCIGK